MSVPSDLLLLARITAGLPRHYLRARRSVNALGRCYLVPRRFMECNETYRHRIIWTIRARIFSGGAS